MIVQKKVVIYSGVEPLKCTSLSVESLPIQSVPVANGPWRRRFAGSILPRTIRLLSSGLTPPNLKNFFLPQQFKFQAAVAAPHDGSSCDDRSESGETTHKTEAVYIAD